MDTEHEQLCATTEQATNGAALDALAAALIPALEEVPRVPQQARSRSKREDLLNAAAVLFSEQGYAATTADEVALAAGVSVGTFYNYFRNKRQILLTLVIERLQDIFTHLHLAEIDLASEDRREAIRAAIAAVLNGEQTGLRRVWLELMSLEPELIPYQQQVRRYALTRLEDRLRTVAVEGALWAGMDVSVAALAVLTLLDALSVQSFEHLGQSFDEARIIDGMTDFIYHALFPPARLRQMHASGNENDSGTQHAPSDAAETAAPREPQH